MINNDSSNLDSEESLEFLPRNKRIKLLNCLVQFK